MIAKDKKLSWVFDNMDKDFVANFKESYNNDKFNSVNITITINV